jgi:hypothetical protein
MVIVKMISAKKYSYTIIVFLIIVSVLSSFTSCASEKKETTSCKADTSVTTITDSSGRGEITTTDVITNNTESTPAINVSDKKTLIYSDEFINAFNTLKAKLITFDNSVSDFQTVISNQDDRYKDSMFCLFMKKHEKYADGIWKYFLSNDTLESVLDGDSFRVKIVDSLLINYGIKAVRLEGTWEIWYYAGFYLNTLHSELSPAMIQYLTYEKEQMDSPWAYDEG